VEPSPASNPSGESLWGGPRTVLAAILAGAAALRLIGIQYGLPFGNLLDPSEQSFVPRAWRVVHAWDFDTQFFAHPSLGTYLLAPSQLGASEPSYLRARIAAAILGVALVAATWLLVERPWGPLAAGVAAAIIAVETTLVAVSHTAVSEVPLALAVTCALILLARGRVLWGAVAAGLALSVSYLAISLLVPLVIAGWGRWRRTALASAFVIMAFAATSPFLLLHPGRAASDIWQAGRLARRGAFGSTLGHFSALDFSVHLWNGFGPVLLIAVLGLVVALAERRGLIDLVLASFVVAYSISLVPFGSHHARYLLPLIPPLAALAARLRSLAPVTMLLLVIPLTVDVRADIELTRTDTRIAAARQIEERIPTASRVAVDPWMAPLEGVNVDRLPLPERGEGGNLQRNVNWLQWRGVEYVVLTGAVEDDVLKQRDRYPRAARFYSQLRKQRPLLRIKSDNDLSGPWVALYKLGKG
jgi:4-amino-4-deoxy-L-arabinose transferase-like glycosyltransferase